MDDWTILIMLFLIGGLTEFITSKYIENQKTRNYISLLVWLGIALTFIILWLVDDISYWGLLSWVEEKTLGD
ncbi:hypothetical protein H1D32_22485 [Anaerobacillus sp. CMMVII]|uniref:hypothetical protein n=1 Tax=Anaerobacillus sp. CMMVII TaxID=2755588 RepID=UPI0021B7C9D6|nr:hypothetical protein [Anaerobacillus sp. CMMVII]MCT8140222.1 hypothetical protein [Anaerobacillus sp. CMMVII]